MAALAPQSPAAAARELLARWPAGVLSTLSVRHGGAPFGSLVPYALSAAGEPLLLLSAIAQHTRNLAEDPRACLTVFDAGAPDPRQAARVAVVGRVEVLEGPGSDDARERYLARHPAARGLLGLDFALHRLVAHEVHFVGGFAAASWLPASALAGEGGG